MHYSSGTSIFIADIFGAAFKYVHVLIRGVLSFVHFSIYVHVAVVSFPDPTTHAREGSGDIGADSWFCKLSSHVIVCTDLYWSTFGHVMVRKTKKHISVPRPFPRMRGGVWE